MSRRKYLKEFMMIILMALILLIFNEGEVKAALQANPNTKATKADNLVNWMTNFRKMEEAGGAMGLNEKLKEDLTSEQSNGIDVHMMKSTEYGAIAILSASGYGNPSNAAAITSTTGNNTGVILNIYSYEWVAGTAKPDIYSGANSRYYDTYIGSDDTKTKIGDALGTDSTTNPGCRRWHNAGYGGWVDAGLYCNFSRGKEGIFTISNSDYTAATFCRGVAVCGTGL